MRRDLPLTPETRGQFPIQAESAANEHLDASLWKASLASGCVVRSRQDEEEWGSEPGAQTDLPIQAGSSGSGPLPPTAARTSGFLVVSI